MKKLINRVDDVLTEALCGFGAAHADRPLAHRRHPRRRAGAALGRPGAPAGATLMSVRDFCDLASHSVCT